ncbi:MAG: hypothetical protein HZB71_10900 [Betaproteobacteria bacterium]|nr:hypothetical protein [Betaproteobacteria bacterium]
MRRAIVLILLLVIPLQFAWATAAGLFGHAGEDVALGVHSHGHDHPADIPLGDAEKGHTDDGLLGSHCHPTCLTLLFEINLNVGAAQSEGPPAYAPTRFLSRTPPRLDRPPLARA